MDEAIAAAGVQPDRVFITGGSARSPLIQAFIRQKLPQVPLEGVMTSARSPPVWPVTPSDCLATVSPPRPDPNEIRQRVCVAI